MQGAECRAAAAAFQIASFLTLIVFDFVLCDVGNFIITQSHSVDVRILLVDLEKFSCVSHYFQIFLLHSLCNRFQIESIFHGLLLH